MAKGLRSSTKKANRSKLRSKVFGPVESARIQRLSAKLLQLASISRGTQNGDTTMEDETSDPERTHQQEKDVNIEATSKLSEADMDLDRHSKDTPVLSTSRKTSRVQKRGRRKASASMVFPARTKGRRLGARRKPKK